MKKVIELIMVIIGWGMSIKKDATLTMVCNNTTGREE